MPILPESPEESGILTDEVFGAPEPISKEEAARLLSVPDPDFFNEDPDA